MKTSLLLVLAAACTAGTAYGQAGAGAKYGARDPFVCKSKKEPASGAPSPSQARDYVKCSSENVVGVMGPKLYLLENVQVEIAKGRPFQATDLNFPDIDNTQLLYPIRGSYDWYICHINEVGFPPGKNCNIYNEPKAAGFCYRTTFGDWNCTMTDNAAIGRGPVLQPVPPPK